jgi:hypothetical protein
MPDPASNDKIVLLRRSPSHIPVVLRYRLWGYTGVDASANMLSFPHPMRHPQMFCCINNNRREPIPLPGIATQPLKPPLSYA